MNTQTSKSWVLDWGYAHGKPTRVGFVQFSYLDTDRYVCGAYTPQGESLGVYHSKREAVRRVRLAYEEGHGYKEGHRVRNAGHDYSRGLWRFYHEVLDGDNTWIQLDSTCMDLGPAYPPQEERLRERFPAAYADTDPIKRGVAFLDEHYPGWAEKGMEELDESRPD